MNGAVKVKIQYEPVNAASTFSNRLVGSGGIQSGNTTILWTEGGFTNEGWEGFPYDSATSTDEDVAAWISEKSDNAAEFFDWCALLAGRGCADIEM